ncbi:MAG: 3-oxoacyl-ACP reductase FabG [Limisphaerales bacterium]
MSERIILITGANGDIGRAIARAFLDEREENAIHLGVRENSALAKDLAAKYPKRCQTIKLDVTQFADWKAAIEKLGRLDVLVNNAGFHDDSLLGQMTDEQWRCVMDVNLNGVFMGCREAVRLMLAQRSGRIVNISSLSALLAPMGQTNYAAAKAAVVAFSQALAKEVARAGVTVNAVCPGYIDSEALEFPDKQARREAQMRIPMRRFGKPEEVAAAVRFLACEEASYLTGSVLKIDGGIL